MQRALNLASLLAIVLAFALIYVKNKPHNDSDTLLNASYDSTRDLYRDIDALFEADYAERTGTHLHVVQSHGASSRQSRAVMMGEEAADVVTLGLYSEVDALRKQGLIADGWAERLPHHSQPYISTIVFVVRRGNPHQIHDWPDLLRTGVELVTPSPKTSGGGKLAALAAWGAIVTRGGTADAATDYLKHFYAHVRALDAGTRAATKSFVSGQTGDVQLAWESEAIREAAEAHGAVEIVYPPVSIRAEPYVAWVDANVREHGSLTAARSYLEFLFSDAAQQVMARRGYRPYATSVPYAASARKDGDPALPDVQLFPITAIARDWDDAQQKFFDDHGIIDTVLNESHR